MRNTPTNKVLPRLTGLVVSETGIGFVGYGNAFTAPNFTKEIEMIACSQETLLDLSATMHYHKQKSKIRTYILIR